MQNYRINGEILLAHCCKTLPDLSHLNNIKYLACGFLGDYNEAEKLYKIEAFPPNLKFLLLRNTQLTEIPELPASLEDLMLMGNSKMTELPNMIHCTKLGYINIDGNTLTEDYNDILKNIKHPDYDSCIFTRNRSKKQLKHFQGIIKSLYDRGLYQGFNDFVLK